MLSIKETIKSYNEQLSLLLKKNTSMPSEDLKYEIRKIQWELKLLDPNEAPILHGSDLDGCGSHEIDFCFDIKSEISNILECDYKEVERCLHI